MAVGAPGRFADAEDQPQPGGVDERQSPEIEHEARILGREVLADYLLELGDRREVELAGENDANTIGFHDSVAAKQRGLRNSEDAAARREGIVPEGRRLSSSRARVESAFSLVCLSTLRR